MECTPLHNMQLKKRIGIRGCLNLVRNPKACRVWQLEPSRGRIFKAFPYLPISALYWGQYVLIAATFTAASKDGGSPPSI
jgi:hypothetical protein